MKNKYRMEFLVETLPKGRLYKSYSLTEYKNCLIWLFPLGNKELVKKFIQVLTSFSNSKVLGSFEINDFGYDFISGQGYVVFPFMETEKLENRLMYLEEVEFYKIYNTLVKIVKSWELQDIHHGRISPEFIFLTQTGVKVLGLGINNFSLISEITQYEYHYTAPEIFNLNHTSIKNDFYSIGSILFEFATKRKLDFKKDCNSLENNEIFIKKCENLKLDFSSEVVWNNISSATKASPELREIGYLKNEY